MAGYSPPCPALLQNSQTPFPIVLRNPPIDNSISSIQDPWLLSSSPFRLSLLPNHRWHFPSLQDPNSPLEESGRIKWSEWEVPEDWESIRLNSRNKKNHWILKNQPLSKRFIWNFSFFQFFGESKKLKMVRAHFFTTLLSKWCCKQTSKKALEKGRRRERVERATRSQARSPKKGAERRNTLTLTLSN